MAKFGIALGSGPRGLGFESRYSDQTSGIRICGFRMFYWDTGIRKTDPNEVRVRNSPVDGFLGRGRIRRCVIMTAFDFYDNSIRT